MRNDQVGMVFDILLEFGFDNRKSIDISIGYLLQIVRFVSDGVSVKIGKYHIFRIT